MMIERSSHLLQLFVFAGCLAFGLRIAEARQINWRMVAGQQNITSAGELLTSQFVFELGWFGEDFTPSRHNTEAWRDH